MTLRPHPHLYEINTWPWLDRLSRRSGRALTLGAVPDAEWDALGALGIDLVYLLGLWRRSAVGRELARSDARLFAAYDRAHPGWRVQDVVGSAFSIAGFDPDPRLATWDELDRVRGKLHDRGMGLVVDFIGNHTGFDHRWVRDHPDRYVNATEDAFRRDPSAFRAIERPGGEVRFIACGRDPYFPPWTDVAQLNYFEADTRQAMVAGLQAIARHADGVRCDMAMLALSEVFGRTWGEFLHAPPPATEFWADARAAVPGLILIAEAYWDLEWRLQQIGFDFTYDKRLYDRLVAHSPRDVRAHLTADAEFQRRSVRFVENHDEPRAAVAFGDRAAAAAVVAAGVPGLRFFHDGQFDGRRLPLPVQLGVMADEPEDERVRAFYQRLLGIVDAPVFHEGAWRLLDVAPSGDDTHADLVAWAWTLGARESRIVVVNLGAGAAQGIVALPDGFGRADLVLDDLVGGGRFPWTRAALDAARGVYVRLDRGRSHIFSVRAAENAKMDAL